MTVSYWTESSSSGDTHRTSRQFRRALSFAVLVAVGGLCVACDGRIDVHGRVTNAHNGEPISGADIWLADIVYNDQMAAYLEEEAQFDEHPNTSGEVGSYRASELLAGPGGHEVWLVVKKPGYREEQVQVWKDTGFPEDDKKVDVTLELAASGLDGQAGNDEK